MARIATIQKKDEIPAEHQLLYDEIAASRGAVGGPWLALLHSPELAQRTAHLGSFVRFESSLDHRTVEFTALVSARELDSKHEWGAHIGHAEKAGIPIETIRAVYERRGAESFSSDDAQIVSLVREILEFHRVSERTFQALYGRFGEKGFVELVATIGYYAMLACTLNTFDVATANAPEEFKLRS
jgi:4-carboxymuconolactone decarboxylase